MSGADLCYGILVAQMTDLTEKEELLESSGYQYHFDRMLYFNRTARRAFSLEFVEEHSQQEILQILHAPPAEDWVFFFYLVLQGRCLRQEDMKAIIEVPAPAVF